LKAETKCTPPNIAGRYLMSKWKLQFYIHLHISNMHMCVSVCVASVDKSKLHLSCTPLSASLCPYFSVTWGLPNMEPKMIDPMGPILWLWLAENMGYIQVTRVFPGLWVKKVPNSSTWRDSVFLVEGTIALHRSRGTHLHYV
jgi:hypothetical protein